MFENENEIREWVRSEHGVGIMVCKSSYMHTGGPVRTYQATCKLSGSGSTARSKKCGCAFSMHFGWAQKLNAFKLTPKNLNHNHDHIPQVEVSVWDDNSRNKSRKRKTLRSAVEILLDKMGSHDFDRACIEIVKHDSLRKKLMTVYCNQDSTTFKPQVSHVTIPAVIESEEFCRLSKMKRLYRSREKADCIALVQKFGLDQAWKHLNQISMYSSLQKEKLRYGDRNLQEFSAP